jgi:hypothetical protein
MPIKPKTKESVKKIKLDKLYDVIYRTSGRTMIAKNVSAKSKIGAMTKVKKEMKASSTFKRCVVAIEI